MIDLASEEYSRAARQGLGENVRWVTVYFGQLDRRKVPGKGNALQKGQRHHGALYGPASDHGRGRRLKEFDGLGFQFWPEASDDQRLYFCFHKECGFL